MINIDKLTNTQKIDLIKDKLFNTFIIYYPQLHKEIFEKFAVDEDWIIRYYLAINPNISISIMEKLAVDKLQDVRAWLARNPSYQKHLKDLKVLNEENRTISKFNYV